MGGGGLHSRCTGAHAAASYHSLGMSRMRHIYLILTPKRGRNVDTLHWQRATADLDGTRCRQWVTRKHEVHLSTWLIQRSFLKFKYTILTSLFLFNKSKQRRIISPGIDAKRWSNPRLLHRVRIELEESLRTESPNGAVPSTRTPENEVHNQILTISTIGFYTIPLNLLVNHKALW